MAIINGGPADDLLKGTDFNDVISGFDGNDMLIGYGGADTLFGGNGADTLFGGNGNDTLIGEAGNDILDGGLGADRMEGGTGDDTYYVNNSGDVVIENPDSGMDTVISSITYTLTSNVENLTLVLGAGAINGTGNESNNTIIGNESNNTINGGLGDDTMIGGLGNDVYIVDSEFDTVTEGIDAGTDRIETSLDFYDLRTANGNNVENLTFTNSTANTGIGNASANTIIGNVGSDTLFGVDGDDRLDGRSGADIMIGGSGNDIYVVDNVGDRVDETSSGLLTDVDTVESSIDFSLVHTGTTVAGIFENLTLTGTANINGTGNTLVNTLIGNSGNNTLDGGGGLEADIMRGGLGDDTYIVDNALDTVTEFASQGIDLVISSVSYQIIPNVENLTLAMGAGAINATGNSGVNTLTGNEFDNALDGREGVDTLIGGMGNDTYFVASTFTGLADIVIELANEGTDTIVSAKNYVLGANLENLTLIGNAAFGTGNSANNLIIGNNFNNILFGLGGNDELRGQGGSDRLDGGIGNDLMIGGLGNDVYIVDSTLDTVTEAFNAGIDKIETSLNLYSLSAFGANVENLTFTNSASNTGFGNDLNNTIIGNVGSDILSAGVGNDRLNGGAGADIMIGGAGDDVYILNDLDTVTEAFNEGIDRVESSLSEYTLAENVENLTLTGTANINGTGNDGANTLIGNSGNNRLDGGAGIDTMAGGLGDDVYVVAQIGDLVTEGVSAGRDRVESLLGTYTLTDNVEDLTLLPDAGTAQGVGNSLNNVIIGNDSNNTLVGLDGNDRLDGGLGADTMVGGAGDDTYVVDFSGDFINELFFGSGTDTVESFSANFSLVQNFSTVFGVFENLTLMGTADINGTGNALANIITGNVGNNTLDGGAGIDTLIGGDGDDVYILNNDSDTVIEGSGMFSGIDRVESSLIEYTLAENVENLTLIGAGIKGNGNSLDNIIIGQDDVFNRLFGFGGNDRLDGGLGDDLMVGGAGDDVYVVDDASDTIQEVTGLATDIDTVESSINFSLVTNPATVFGAVENLTLTGTAHINGTGNALANIIIGNSGLNTLSGGLGNDTLDGGAGIDTMIGGAGDDTYVVDNASDIVDENAGIDTVESSISFSLVENFVTVFGDFENLTLTGTDSIDGIGNDLDNILIGNSGMNTLRGGSAGNDTLDGGLGADIMIGGIGDDVYIVDDAGDLVSEAVNQGRDRVESSLTYILDNNVENLTLTGVADINGTGNALANIITGNSGHNTLDGGIGNDLMIGGIGSDIYVVDNALDVVDESTGSSFDFDTVGSSITYTLAVGSFSLITGDVEALILIGSDNINGTGNALANLLIGNSGNNTLDGGFGADQMSGGAGDDVYIVDHNFDVVIEPTNQGIDRVESSITYTLGNNVENLTLTGHAVSGFGNALDNIIIGNADDNELRGFAGNDRLDGGLGGDYMEGGSGNDTYVVDSLFDLVDESTFVSAGIDTVESSISFSLAPSSVVFGDVENLTLTGVANINGTGNALANILIGNSGHNTLDGGAGIDNMSGGAGDDVYIVDNNGDVVIEAFNQGIDTVESSISYSIFPFNFVENLTLVSGAVTAVGNNIDNIIIGQDGVFNNLFGLGGNDRLNGGLGADAMAGGIGDDVYVVDDAFDIIQEGLTTDIDTVESSISFSLVADFVTVFGDFENLTLIGGAFNGFGNTLANIIIGNAEANLLDGDSGADTLNGGLGSDQLVGGLGADTMIGGEGDDTYVVDDALDVVDESTGLPSDFDTVESSISFSLAPSSFVLGDVEALTLTGTDNINGTGNDFNNTILGNSGDNTLNGGLGNDLIEGGLGANIYIGGLGDDTLVAGNDPVFTDAFNFNVTYGVLNDATTSMGEGVDRILLIEAFDDLVFQGVNDVDSSTVIDLADLEQSVTVTDAVAGGDVVIAFKGDTSSISLVGQGTGTMTSLADITSTLAIDVFIV